MTTEEVTNMIKSRAKENGTISSPSVNTPVVPTVDPATKPVTPVVDAKPVTPVVDAKPVTPVVDSKPLTGGRSKSIKKRRKKRTKKKTRKHL